MKVKNIRRYFDMLPSDFDDKEVRFVNGNNIFVIGKYVDPVDENVENLLDLRIRKEKK